MDSTSLTFYTYIYLDPRKPGRYEYGDYAFNFEPFYVGKGNGNRYKEHLKRAFRNNNDQMFFYNKIRKVKDQTGRFPAVQLVEENLTEQEAFELEIWLIWAIGRKYFGGCLTNLSDGGTGTCGTPRAPARGAGTLCAEALRAWGPAPPQLCGPPPLQGAWRSAARRQRRFQARTSLARRTLAPRTAARIRRQGNSARVWLS